MPLTNSYAARLPRPALNIPRINLDTGREHVSVIPRRSCALRPNVFRGFSRIELNSDSRSMLTTLLLTDDKLVGPDELALSEPAFRHLGLPVGSLVNVTPASPPASLDAVRAKIQGNALSEAQLAGIVEDIAHYRYSGMEIAAFLIGSASFMTSGELLALSRAMALRLIDFDPKTVVVGLDAESRPRAADLADRLGLDFAVAQKTRRGDCSVVTAFADPALFAGRLALMVDDIVSSGAMLTAATKALHAAGASTVDAIVTHALFALELMRVLFEAGIRSLKSSDSVPHPTNAIPLDGILAAALRQEIAA